MRIHKFLIVGISNTLLAYLLFIALVKLGINYKIALFFQYLFGILFGYLFNRYWTFAYNKQNRSFIKYLLLYIGIFLLNSILLIYSVDFLLLGAIFSQFIIIGFMSILSFLIQKNWVFTSKIEKI
jgi:putative flippase GtrA